MKSTWIGRARALRRSWAPGLAGALVLLLTPGCRDAPAPDVLLITVDTLRRDALGSYGYPRPASPHLDALGSAGAVFENHYTVISTTAPAHATMFTGLYPRQHGLMKNGRALGGDLPSLPEFLRRSGYRTGASIGAGILGSELGFQRGFEVFDEDFSSAVHRPEGKRREFERYGDSVVDRALQILAADDGRPLFLWVHLYDAHDPYQPPQGFAFDAAAGLSFFAERSEPSAEFQRPLLARMLAGYEAEVRWVDTQIGRLMSEWDARGKENLVVVTSDHGEGLGEHGYQGHGFFLYEEQLQVPLFMRMEGRLPAQTRVQAQTSMVDLPGTMLDLLGLGGRELFGAGGFGDALLEQSAIESRTIFAERRFYTEDDLRRRPALLKLALEHGQDARGSRGEKRVLIEAGWKFIWNSNEQHELYNLEQDPAERRSVAGKHPERVQAMAAALKNWLAEHPERNVAGDAESDGEWESMLDALGY